MAARYPGDPRARPARGYCSVTATGSIKRRRDDLINRAAVCWLNTSSHDTKPHHVGEAIRGRMHLRHNDFQVVKHYPEQFLVIFNEPADRQRLLDRGAFNDNGRDFHFAPWSERRNAVNTNWEFRVKVRIEGVPVHCWVEEVAAMAIGKSCAVHFLEERTRRWERARTFDLWAWCCDPTDIPKEVTLTVTEPDRELPPISIPLTQPPPHYDAPVDLKRAHVYNLRNHLEVVEDLSFLQGRGTISGPRNRKPLRDMVWSYGAPDSVGERLQGRRDGDRGRDLGTYQRRDDDDHDHNYHHGYRRHRSVSSWARNARGRSGMEDCLSSNRWRSGRGSPPARRTRVAPTTTAMVWRKKEVQAGKKKKTVSFASCMLCIMEKGDKIVQAQEEETMANTNKESDNNDMASRQHCMKPVVAAPAEKDGGGAQEAIVFEKDGVQHALTETLKIMQKQLASPTNNPRPIETSKMGAIQALIEQGIKKKKVANNTKKATAKLGLEA